MVFDQCDSHLCVLADDVDIFGAFDHDGCIVVVALVEADYRGSLLIVADCELAFASIAFPFILWAFDKLVHFEWLDILFLFVEQPLHLVISKESCIVFFDHLGDIFHFTLNLLIVGEGVKGSHYILNFCAFHFLYLFRGCLLLYLLSRLLHILNRSIIIFRDIIFLFSIISQHSGLHFFTFAELVIELLAVNFLIQLHNKEGFVLHFTDMGDRINIPKIFPKKFEALLGVEEFFNSPDTELIC